MKYHEIMDKIEVTDERKKRIMNHINHEDFSNKNKIVPISNFRKYLSIAVCLIIIVIGGITIPRMANTTDSENDVVTAPDILEFTSAEALTKEIGFEIEDINSLKDQSEKISYIAYGDMGEITYNFDDESICYRKSKGNEDNSGDYTEYENEKTLVVAGYNVTLKGNEDLYNNASWSDDYFSYSIYSFEGLSQQELQDYISEIMGQSVKETITEKHGSADLCSGNTVIVTIFVNDAADSWDFSKEEDTTRKEQYLSYLGIACDYLQNQAANYNQSLNCIFDFNSYNDLSYTCSTDLYPGVDEWDMSLWEYIDSNVPVTTLLDKYDSENILFITCMNTDESNTEISCTRNWYPEMPYSYEFVSLYFVDYGEVNAPAVYAHEILHCFGAPDLYTSNDEYGIDDSFVSWIEENIPNDIMYSCSDMNSGDYLYTQIKNEISEVTAYYIGWVTNSNIVEEHNLKQNQRDSSLSVS